MISEIQIDEQSRWDQAVRSFPEYDVFYLSGYSKAFMRENPVNGIPVLLLYEDGNDRAIHVVLKRDVSLEAGLTGKIPAGKHFDLITPYGYGGFLGSVSDWEKLNRTYREYCTDNGYVCEFVRFELFSDYSAHYSGAAETRTHTSRFGGPGPSLARKV